MREGQGPVQKLSVGEEVGGRLDRREEGEGEERREGIRDEGGKGSAN